MFLRQMKFDKNNLIKTNKKVTLKKKIILTLKRKPNEKMKQRNKYK